MSHTAYRKEIPIIIFTKQTRLKNTCMKNKFQPVCSHFPTDFSTDESELLYFHVKRVRYKRITTELVVLRSLMDTQNPTIYNLSMISRSSFIPDVRNFTTLQSHITKLGNIVINFILNIIISISSVLSSSLL